jgi:hypothetical protein
MKAGGVGTEGVAPVADGQASAILNAKYSGMEDLNYFGYGNRDAPRRSEGGQYYW